ncbi:MAG: NBR1-Ig-like domain-containing protein [Anaerolineae bacterium]
MKKIIYLTILTALLVGGCGSTQSTTPTPPDITLIQTSAAQTVVAEFTLTAQAFTPTREPLPTPTLEQATETPATIETALTLPGITPTLTLCDKYSWDPATVDVNIPDGTQMTPGQEFVKTWKIKNAGSCPWGAGYGLIYAGYAVRMSGQPQPLGTVVQPGQEVEVSVQFKAPTQLGEYVSAWTMANARGIPFFGNNNKPLYVKIVVK